MLHKVIHNMQKAKLAKLFDCKKKLHITKATWKLSDQKLNWVLIQSVVLGRSMIGIHVHVQSVLVIYLGHIACLPPSTGRWAPVVKLASSLARNAIALATSDASPTLPRAWVVLPFSRNYKNQQIDILNIIWLNEIASTYGLQQSIDLYICAR